VALAEMAMAGGIGADIIVPDNAPALHAWLFGEDQARYVVVTDGAEATIDAAAKAGITANKIGVTGGLKLTVEGIGTISVTDLQNGHEGWLPEYMSSP